MSFAYYHCVEDGWRAMFEALAVADSGIDVEQYIVEEEGIGRRLVESLAAKARQGARVRLLCDAFGSSGLRVSDLPRVLERSGAEVRFYAPPLLKQLMRRPLRLPRNHRKAMIVDGHRAFVGGICFADHMRAWRDDLVRVDGEMARDVEFSFEQAWLAAAPGDQPSAPTLQNESDGRDKRFTYLVNRGPTGERELYDRLMERIRVATRSVRLTSPYLAHNRRLLRALRSARRRGASVRLILPRRSDNQWADLVSRLSACELLRSDIEVRWFQPGMLHAKSAIVDADWAMTGSLNLDLLSLHINLENAVVSRDREFVSALAHQFEADLARASFRRTPK